MLSLVNGSGVTPLIRPTGRIKGVTPDLLTELSVPTKDLLIGDTKGSVDQRFPRGSVEGRIRHRDKPRKHSNAGQATEACNL